MGIVFVDHIDVVMGAASTICATITNTERLVYRDVPQPSLRPITVMNSVSPLCFHQAHKWVEGEIHVKSEATAAVHGQAIDYLPAGAAAPVCTYCLGIFTGHDASKWTVTFTGAKFSSEEIAHGHDAEGISVYKFVALTASLTS